MKMKVTGHFMDKDLGMKNMLRLMNTLRDPRSLEIGLPEGTPMRALKLGLWHEFGTRTNTPARPWLSTTTDRYAADWLEAWEKDFWTVFKNPQSKQTAVWLQTRMGQRAVRDMKRTILDSSNWQANAEATVIKKGFDWPLYENGWFADQISFKLHPPPLKVKK